MTAAPDLAIDHDTFALAQIATPVTRLILRETHLLKLTKAFKETLLPADGQAIEPILIDLTEIEGSGKWIDFPALLSLLKNYQLHPIAVLGGSNKQREQATLAQLPIIEPRESATAAPIAITPPSAPPAPPAVETPLPAAALETPGSDKTLKPPMVIRQPIRSGAELYARDSDLIIINTVASGARVVADGSIYIHGALKGTAAAGVNGMADVRIFCESFEPQIIAINGIYLDGEQLAKNSAWGKRALIQLNEHNQIDVRSFPSDPQQSPRN
ncbi:septum site-determining protein MinC [Halothiobacillus sp. DCM-1]|uniref:septum site-determining protein MinC n=1 Tax=Halothiobacillus sp. DCM-1 TaxID=3112558 RepID=UPI003252D476